MNYDNYGLAWHVGYMHWIAQGTGNLTGGVNKAADQASVVPAYRILLHLPFECGAIVCKLRNSSFTLQNLVSSLVPVSSPRDF